MKIFFFNVPKPRVFNYKPLYYDPEKEDLQERVKKVEDELNGEKKDDKEYKIKRENFNFKKAFEETKRSEKKSPLARILTYAAILLFVVVAYLLSDKIAYLFDGRNYKKTNTEQVEQNPETTDWSEDTQITIVDD